MADLPSSTTQPFHSLRWRAGNAFVSWLARLGVGPIQLLTTRGSSSGREHTVPVVPVDHDGKTWLVAAYGVVDWVRNTRSTQRVRLRYGRTERRYRTREASSDEAAPVLKRYLAIAPKARPQFATPPEAPTEQFVAEAARHPVFELIEIEREAR